MTVNSIEMAINFFSKISGLGSKSARRLVLHVLKNKEKLNKMQQITELLIEEVKVCEICGNLDVSNICHICSDNKRDHGVICVVEDIEDMWNIEKSHSHVGVYQVLNGYISPIDGIMPENLRINDLIQQMIKLGDELKEIIFANNKNLQSQSTIFYIKDMILEQQNAGKISKIIAITELAHGLPLGSSLDYIDEGTINAAFKRRSVL